VHSAFFKEVPKRQLGVASSAIFDGSSSRVSKGLAFCKAISKIQEFIAVACRHILSDAKPISHE